MNNGISGPLLAPSSYFMKSPPEQYHDDIARNRTDEFINNNRQEPSTKGPGRDSRGLIHRSIEKKRARPSGSLLLLSA